MDGTESELLAKVCITSLSLLICSRQRRVRLYTTRSLKPLGTLDYHKKNTQAVVFAHSSQDAPQLFPARGEEDEDEDMTESEKEARARWLAAGSQDCRVSIWPLMSFEKIF